MRSAAAASRIGVAGTVALIWGALGVFGAITTAVNYAWGVEKQHSFWKHKLVSFVMLLVAGLILLIALLLVSATQVVSASWFAEVLVVLSLAAGCCAASPFATPPRCCSSPSSG